MKILIAGGTGMIGQLLVSELRDQMLVTIVGRSTMQMKKKFPYLPCLSWQALSETDLSDFDIIVNLAGHTIACRWHNRNKQRILKSRVETTSLLANRCAQLGTKSPVLINASAIGVYGFAETAIEQNQIVFDEGCSLPSTPTDFLATVGQAWEDALQPAKDVGVRVVTCRFGVVLAKQGGALAHMVPSFNCGLGAVLGKGEQPISWVCIDDAVSALIFLIKHDKAHGAYNIVANEVINQKVFAHALAKHLHRRCWLRLPGAIVKLLFGEMGDTLLLNGQCVISKRLQEMGFRFQYKTLEEGLNASLSRHYELHYNS